MDMRLTVFLLALVLAGDAMAARKPSARELLKTEQEADLAYEEGRNEEAARLYVDLSKAVPNEPTYWYRMANALARTQHLQEAAIAYQQSLSRDPSNGRAWHNLGIVRLQLAQESFAEAVKLTQPGDEVFDKSLRISTSLYSLTEQGDFVAPPRNDDKGAGR